MYCVVVKKYVSFWASNFPLLVKSIFNKKDLRSRKTLDSNVTSGLTFVFMEKHYTVQQLSRLAGVSVRTLHHYDSLGLLQPEKRSASGYRLYGESELLRLQQILFYRELHFPLTEIAAILDDPGFDMLQALEKHRVALEEQRNRISALLNTIGKTINKLKGGPIMLTHEELYEGFPQGLEHRKEAVSKWGEKTVEDSENSLRLLNKAALKKLTHDFQQVFTDLRTVMHRQPTDRQVQTLISKHFSLIQRFWNVDSCDASILERYKGLANLYITDDRYIQSPDGKPDPAFADFISKAMIWFANHATN